MNMTLAFLLAALGGVADEPQAKPAPTAAAAQDPDRPAISPTELKALRDNNIFAPKSASKRPPRSKEGSISRSVPTPVRPKAPQVTAIFLDAASQAYQVIVEDRNDSSRRFFKDPKFMKAGDEWSGIKLESVTQDKAVFSRDGASKEVHIGEPIAEIDSKPLSAAAGDSEGFDDGESPAPSDVTLPAPSGSTTSPSSPGTSKKSMYRSRTESAGDSKTVTPENQSRTLDEMKKRLKKNRPADDQ